MLFFFDESGDFTIRDGDANRCGVVSAVVVPEADAPFVRHAYRNFLTALTPSEKPHGEPKGRLFTRKSRRMFADLMGTFPNLMSYTVVLDLLASRQDMVTELPTGMRDTILNASKACVHESMRKSMALLSKQVANLNNGQFARLFALGQAMLGSINASNIHYIEPGDAASYESMSFVVDQVSNREKIVVDILLRLWLPTWSHYEPIILVETIHDAGHPLVKKFGCAEGVVGKKLISDNLSFADSRSSWGVQMADIVANTMQQAANNPENGPHAVAAEIVANGHRFPWASIRFFAFGERSDRVQVHGLRSLIRAIEAATGQRYDPDRYKPD